MRRGDKKYGGSIRIKIELVIIKIVIFFFCVCVCVLINTIQSGFLEIDQIPIKGYFLWKRNGKKWG